MKKEQNVMERNEKGEVRENGKLVCTIPLGTSMLAVLGVNGNPPTGACIFGEDYWMYVDGKKIRKWFQNSYSENHGISVKIWPPILKDIPKLEARCQKIAHRYHLEFNTIWTPAFNAVVKVKQAHAKITHQYTGKYPPYWLYHASDLRDGKHGIGFDWLEKTPKKFLNLEIGNAWYQAEYRLGTMATRWHMFTTVLSNAIHDYLWINHRPTADNVTMRLIINGRDYWYRTAYDTNVIVWKELVWPEDKVITVCL